MGVNGPQHVRDLWRHKDLGVYSDEFSVELSRHSGALLRLFPAVK